MSNHDQSKLSADEAVLLTQYRTGLPVEPIDLPAFGQRLLEMFASVGSDESAKGRLMDRLSKMIEAVNFAYALLVRGISPDKAAIEVQRFIDSLKLPALD